MSIYTFWRILSLYIFEFILKFTLCSIKTKHFKKCVMEWILIQSLEISKNKILKGKWDMNNTWLLKYILVKNRKFLVFFVVTNIKIKMAEYKFHQFTYFFNFRDWNSDKHIYCNDCNTRNDDNTRKEIYLL